MLCKIIDSSPWILSAIQLSWPRWRRFFWSCSTSWKIPRELELTRGWAYADSHRKITCALAKCPRGESFSYPLAIFQINTQRNTHAHTPTHTYPHTHTLTHVFYFRVFLLSILPAAWKSLTRILSRRKVSDFLELKLKPKFVLQKSKGIDTIFYSSLFPWFGFIDNVVSHRWYSDNAPLRRACRTFALTSAKKPTPFALRYASGWANVPCFPCV